MTFSERMGLKPKKVFQIDSMDNDLVISLWNEFYSTFWPDFVEDSVIGLITSENGRNFLGLLNRFFIKRTIDDVNDLVFADHLLKYVKKTFLGLKWNEIYDFLIFIVEIYKRSPKAIKFIENCNHILSIENSAYRFVGYEIAPITSESEIAEIEKAMESPLEMVNQHLKKALQLLSNRENPDYCNSIKESISAVETLCRKLTGANDLGKALDKLESKGIVFHKAFKDGLQKFYHYTCDEDGVRHSALEEPKVNVTDARFMFIICSAFVNFLNEKTREAGISL